MAIQLINLGNYANDGSGDDLRTAFQKVNANFSEIDTSGISGGSNLGSGAPLYAGNVANPTIGDSMSFRSLVGGDNVTITYDGNSITISSPRDIDSDLDLNGNDIVGTGNINITGNVNATNIDDALNTINTFDFGSVTNTYENPITYLLDQVGVDMGSFTDPADIDIDIGTI